MEVAYESAQKFLIYLKEIGILNLIQQNQLHNTIEQTQSKKIIFILADFFRKLSPSESYDLVVRLFDHFNLKKQEIEKNKDALKVNPVSNIFRQRIFNNENLENANKNLSKPSENNNINELESENNKPSRILPNIFALVQKEKEKAMKNNNNLNKNQTKCVQMAEKLSKLINRNHKLLSLQFFAHLKENKMKAEHYILNDLNKSLNNEPRKLSIAPESIDSQTDEREREKSLMHLSKSILTPNQVHQRLYSAAAQKKVNLEKFQSLKKKNEIEGCTFRPSINKTIYKPPDSVRSLTRQDSNGKIINANAKKNEINENQHEIISPRLERIDSGRRKSVSHYEKENLKKKAEGKNENLEFLAKKGKNKEGLGLSERNALDEKNSDGLYCEWKYKKF